MIIEDISKGRVVLADADLTIDKIVCEKGSAVPAIADELRFIYAPSGAFLHSSSVAQYIPERTAIKVQPGVAVEFETKEGSSLYVTSLNGPEQSRVDFLKKLDYPSDYPKDLRIQWDLVKDAGLDYVLKDADDFAKHIISFPGLVIAPSHSRRNPCAGNGWHLRFERGSKALAFGSDLLYGIRAQEKIHRHKIATEVYVALGGTMLMAAGDSDILVKEDMVMMPEEGEYHGMKEIVSKPYHGFTLQLPGLPLPFERILKDN